MMFRIQFVVTVAVLGLGSKVHAAALAIAWDDANADVGVVRAIATSSPWDFVSKPLTVGRQSTLRFAEERLYVLSPVDDTITVVNPDMWTIQRSYQLPPGSFAVDIAVSGQTAYVTRENSTHLLRLNLIDGSTSDVLDLSEFADPDGIPDLRTMSLHEGRLFIQIQRRNLDGPRGFLPPAYLAVMDVATEQMIDVDPTTPGVQGIELLGTAPKHKMQVVPATRQLFVSATGATHDEGGVEVIDLNSLQAQGLIVREADGLTGVDIGPFIMVSPQEGFLSDTTDALPSSHFLRFSRNGVEPNELHQAVNYLTPALEFDPSSNSVFFPHSGDVGQDGLHVFDATTGERLNRDIIAVGGRPTDIVLVPEPDTPTLLVSAFILFVLLRGKVGISTAIIESLRESQNLSPRQ